MDALTLKDRELIKLRSARMSERSIAGLMGRGWTEARVKARLAEIEAFEAGEEEPVSLWSDVDGPSWDRGRDPSMEAFPDPPAVLCPVTDAAEDRIEIDIEGWAEAHRPLLPPDHPVKLMMTRSTPWEEATLSFLEANPGGVPPTAPIRLPSSAGKFEFFLARNPIEEPCLETLPLPLELEQASTEPDPVTASPPEAPADPPVEASSRKPRGPRRPEPQAVAVLAQPAAPAVVRPHSGPAVRLRPVTDRIIRFAAWFAAARWPVEEIAELFDVSPEQLEKVLA